MGGGRNARTADRSSRGGMTTGQLETKTKIQKYKNTGGAEAVRQLVHINCQYWSSLKRVRYADHHFDWFKMSKNRRQCKGTRGISQFSEIVIKAGKGGRKKNSFQWHWGMIPSVKLFLGVLE